MDVIQTKQTPLKNTSHAIKAGDFVYVSGQIGMDYATGTLKGMTVEDELEQAFKNLKEVLQSARLTLNHVVKIEMRLVEMKLLRDADKLYAKVYPGEHVPARDVYAVQTLHKGAKVEISAVAYAGK